MTKLDLLQASFNAGELSPRLHARVDFIKYPAGLETCLNLIPLPEGGVTRRPGTRFVAETIDSTKKSRLFSFEATAEQHHVLELGENKIRFFFRQGQQFVLDTDAAITNGLFTSDITDWDDRSTGSGSITHDATNGRLNLISGGLGGTDIGWAEQDVTTTDTDQEHVIKFEVIGDPGDRVEFQVGTSNIVSDILGPVEMRVGFHCVAFTPTVSPFFIQFRSVASGNKTIQIDNVSFIDNAPLEIDSPYIEAQLFQIMGAQSNDVKYLFRQGVAPYKLERRALASWSLVRVAWQDGPYITQNSEATTLTPTFNSGVAVPVTASQTRGINSGSGFLSTDVGRLIRIDNGSEWGWGIIVAVTSTTVVDVHVKKAFVDTSATAKWRLGAWSDTTGWPKTGGFFEQRLYVASTDDQSQTLWGSQTGDFENFKPDDDKNVVEDDDALNFTLSADSVGEIRWLSAGEDTLAIGTAGGEWVPSASGIVITPLDITIRRQTTHGSALIAPLRIDHVVLFVQKAGRKIREFVFNFEFDSFLAPDLTRLAQHITAPSIDDMAFQQEPDSVVWAIRGDGKLLSLTFRRDEDVVGWARHDIGGRGSTGSEATFSITGGSSSSGVNTISSITVDGVEILPTPIDWAVHNEVTALTIAEAINSGLSATFDNVQFSVESEEAIPTNIRFNDTGTKMFVIGGTASQTLFQYTLSTAFDLTTISYDNLSADLEAIKDDGAMVITGFTFGKSGTKLYAIDIIGTDFIYEFDLSNAYDVTTITYDGKFRDDGIFAFRGIEISADGTRLFLGTLGGSPEAVCQFSLSTPFDITTATSDSSVLNVSGTFLDVHDIFVNELGTKLFVIGIGPDPFAALINRYDLATPWTLSTAVFGETIDVSDEPVISHNADSVAFSTDLKKMFVLQRNDDVVFQYSLGSDITASFELCFVTIVNSVRDLSNWAYDGQSFTPAEGGSFYQAVDFADGGLRMYISATGGSIYQYRLGSAYDMLTAFYDSRVFDTSAQGGNSKGISFKPDGLKMFVNLSGLNQGIFQYTLTTAFDVSTAVYDQKFLDINVGNLSPGVPLNDAADHHFRPDGFRVFVVGDKTSPGNDSEVAQFSLSIAWDISTATYDDKSFVTTNNIDDQMQTLFFTADGAFMYMTGRSSSGPARFTVYQYLLSTPWDVSTAVRTSQTFDVDNETTVPIGIAFDLAFTKMFVIANVSGEIFQYTVSVDGTFRSACDAEITILRPPGASGPGSVIITTTGDVTVDNITPAMSATGVSLSESVVTILGNDGSGQVQNSEDRDEVWVTVQRTINGVTKRYVEFFEGYYDDLLHDQEDAYYADSIITYDDVLTDTIAGLSHLEGETVKVWGDGAILPDVVVVGGQIILSTAVKVAQIGLAYTHRLKTLKIEGGSPIGTAVGQKKRINGITFVLLNSHTISFGRDVNNLFKTDFRLVSDPMDAGAPLFTGEQFREFDGDLTPDARIIVESDDPAPFTLLAMVPEVKVMPAK